MLETELLKQQMQEKAEMKAKQ